jgi:hypothetical protein
MDHNRISRVNTVKHLSVLTKCDRINKSKLAETDGVPPVDISIGTARTESSIYHQPCPHMAVLNKLRCEPENGSQCGLNERVEELHLRLVCFRSDSKLVLTSQ